MEIVKFNTVFGQRFGNIEVCEDNRQSVWETESEEVKTLICIAYDSFIARGVEAVVAAIYDPLTEQDRYAIFVEDGFLVA